MSKDTINLSNCIKSGAFGALLFGAAIPGAAQSAMAHSVTVTGITVSNSEPNSEIECVQSWNEDYNNESNACGDRANQECFFHGGIEEATFSITGGDSACTYDSMNHFWYRSNSASCYINCMY